MTPKGIEEFTTRCGYVALVGRPNAGKSSLMNALVGAKIAGVSAKPQTTRNKILGIASGDDWQALFLDTPGLHKPKKSIRLNAMMNVEAWSSIEDADVVCFLVDVARGWRREDEKLFSRVVQIAKTPVLVLATKVDSRKKAEVKAAVEGIKAGVAAVLSENPSSCVRTNPILVSAKRRESLDGLMEQLKKELPPGPFLFAPDELTDRPRNFVIAEFIREKLFRYLGEEIPYQTGVVVEKFEEKPKVIVIYAAIIVARSSQKGIVVGKRGEGLKRVGSEAREQIEELLQKKVFLDLQVKVDEDWFDSDDKIAAYVDIQQ